MTVEVEVMAFVRVFARRERASGRGVWLVLPGLGGVSIWGFEFGDG